MSKKNEKEEIIDYSSFFNPENRLQFGLLVILNNFEI